MSQSTLIDPAPIDRRFRRAVLLLAIALAALADALNVFDNGGLSLTLWALAGVLVALWALHRRGAPPARETLWALGGALLFAGVFTVRSTVVVQALSFLAALILIGIAAGQAGTAWLGTAGPGQVARAAGRVIMHGMIGPLAWGLGTTKGTTVPTGWRHRTRVLLWGTVLALPALLVFGGMLRSADPVFDQVMTSILRVDLEPLLEHLIPIAVIAWGVAGYLAALLRPTPRGAWYLPRPGLGAAEVSVALWLINALFIAFLLVQLRYLFGGAELVQATVGLSYAEYARRGFFELVMIAALVVPVLLAADWASAPNTPRHRALLRVAMVVLLLLLGGVLGSAAARMAIYQQAYGLTASRLYASVLLVWVGGALFWLGYTLLRDRRERFMVGATVLGFVCLAGLVVCDPDALIARVNLARAAAGAAYDGSYLDRLGAEAVPVLLTQMAVLSEAERCRIGNRLVERWGGDHTAWQAWNLGDARARRLVHAARDSLTCQPIPAAAAATP